MGLMDRMMDRMINNMSVPEKEDLMLKMMPAMMELIDISKTMPEALAALGRLTTLTGIAVLINKALNDDELKEEIGELLSSLREKKPELAEVTHDIMPATMSFMSESGLMDGMMNTMGKMMPVMMPAMREMAPIMMREKMPEVMAEHDSVREMMSEMMMIDVIPHCVDTMLPMFAPDQTTAFLSQLAERIGRAASRDSLSNEDHDDLEQAFVGKIKAGFEAHPG